MGTKSIKFRTNSRHISQLGRELVTDFVTALTELIKNSYDADAEGVKIIFDNVKTDNGKITIIDTGSGMTQNDVENKWMVIGTNNKVRDNYSKLGRKRVGKKGIGRFSVERLAEKVCIYSFTEYEKPFKFSVNWNKYEEINIKLLQQKINVLRNIEDEDSAKYIKTQLEYFLLSDKVQEKHKNTVKEILEFDEKNYRIFFEQEKLTILEKQVIPMLRKYEDIEEKIDDIYNEIEVLETEEESKVETYLKEYYEELNINRKTVTGTVIVLDNLRDTWKDKHITRLQKELRQLVAPEFIEKNAFKVKLVAPEFKIEDATLANDVLSASFAVIKAKLTENGRRMIIEYNGKDGDNRNEDKILDHPKLCGDVELELYYFIRDSKNLFTDDMNSVELRKLLDLYCGIKIYRDNFRVKPYGDTGNDWLLLDQDKIKETHGYLVGNNQTIGVVRITEEKNGMLIDATNREGIIENEAYEDLKWFVKKCTTMISDIRYEKFLKEQEEKNKELKKIEEMQKENDENFINVINSQKEEYNKLEEVINSSDIKDEKSIQKLIDYSKQFKENTEKSLEETKKNLERSKEYTKEMQDIYESKMENTKEEANLYKNLASLGVLSAEFGHETKDVSSRAKRTIELLNEDIKKSDIVKLKTHLDVLNRDMVRILSYIDIINGFITKGKRNRININMKRQVQNITKLYEILIQQYNIEVVVECDEDVVYKMAIMDLESILINLFTNSFEQVKKVDKRIIFIKIEDNKDNICIRFIDSGPGIQDITPEDIFKPFKTTKENGTGLGMCIIKANVEKYNGSIAVTKSKTYGGAEFIIELPKEE